VSSHKGKTNLFKKNKIENKKLETTTGGGKHCRSTKKLKTTTSGESACRDSEAEFAVPATYWNTLDS
jgi:hypothetical protein